MTSDRRTIRAAVGNTGRNSELQRYVITHFLSVIAEWSALIGLLVFTFERAGARAAGFASLTALAPYCWRPRCLHMGRQWSVRLVRHRCLRLLFAGEFGGGLFGCGVVDEVFAR